MNENKKRVKRGWMGLKVSAITQENHNTRTIWFEDAQEGGRCFDYVAGQYLTFRFDDIADKPVVRSYTMSSWPDLPDRIGVTVKEVDQGFVSRHLCREVEVGDTLRARGPIGKFCYHPDADEAHLVMIAAGSGVTPFVSIMGQESTYLDQPQHPTRLSLLVGFRSQQDLICWDTLQRLNDCPGIDVVTYLSREDATGAGFRHGRLDVDALSELCGGNFAGKTYMTCGPNAMMDGMSAFLLEKGVHAERIKTESFD